MKYLFIILMLSMGYHDVHSQHNIIPKPFSFSPTSFTFAVSDFLLIYDENIPSIARERIINQFTHFNGINLVFSKNKGSVIFMKDVTLPRAHYSLVIDTLIRISYSTNESALHAVYSLSQLFNKSLRSFPGCIIYDYPQFEYRGMHLDVSRHFFSVKVIKEYLEWMSYYKFNKFHWHLTDDQGWRIEIKKYPLLTSIGATRDSTLIGHASKRPTLYDAEVYQGFYTQDDIQDVVEFASKLGIEVIPEIDIPGHASAALAAYPEFGCRESYQVESSWGVFDPVFCTRDETMTFIKDVLDEITELFPGKLIHVGGDEVLISSWETCLKCQHKLNELNFSKTSDLQRFFLNEIQNHLMRKGKTVVAWDEVLEGPLLENITIMAWRGEEPIVRAASQGLKVIASPNSTLYFDHYESRRSSEPVAIGGLTTLEKVYYYTPVPEALKGERSKNVIGAQANVWTEYIPSRDLLHYKIFPRMLALSESLWSLGKNYNFFINRLENHHFSQLKEKGIPYNLAYQQSKYLIEPFENGIDFKVLSYNGKSSISVSENGKELKEELGELNYRLFPTANLEIRSLQVLSSQQSRVVDSFSIILTTHGLLNFPIQLKTQASSMYGGKGAFTLTNGVFGQRPWNGEDWLGFRQDTIELNIDQTNFEKRSDLGLSFLEAPESWIYLPTSVILEYEIKPGKFSLVERKVDSEILKISFKKKYKSLKIKIIGKSEIGLGLPGEGNPPWIFMDEIFYH